MATPAIQTLITDAQQVLNLKSLSEIRATLTAVLANANVGTPLNPNLTTQQLWDEFYEIVRQSPTDIESILVNQMMKFVFSPPAPGGAGANHEVIYNNNGVLAGDPKFLWDDALNKLDIDGSATISGDLTVDTSTLKVDSANDRVGFGTASPAQGVHLSKSSTSTALTSPPVGGASFRIQNTSSTNNNFGSVEFYNAAGLFGASVNCQYTNQATPTSDLVFVTRGTLGGLEHYRIAADGVATWSEVGGVAGTAMTLNSTGLGLGVSPVTALSFPIGSTRVVSQSATTNHAAGNVGTLKFGISDGGGDYSGLHVVNSHNGTYSSQDLLFFTGEGGVSLSLERMRITRSGNLILSAPNTPPTLTTNGQLTVNATSNTNLRFSYRGSDGTTRVANITLA
jgi:hypothetical protein